MKRVAFLASFLAFMGVCAASTSWPNEPPNPSALFDNPLSVLPGPGCTNVYPGSDGTIISDPAAPLSGPGVLQQRKNPVTGMGGAVLNCNFPRADRIYAGMWFKSSPDFFGVYSNQNKLTGYFAQAFGNFFRMDIHKYADNTLHMLAGFNGLSRSGPGQGNNCHLSGSGLYSVGTECDGVAYFLRSNVDDSPITRGEWHRLEVIAQLGSCATCKDGMVRWWVDGKLRGNYTNFNHAMSPFVSWALTHTWDGGGCPGGMQNCNPPGSPYSVTDYWYIDHMYTSTFAANGLPLPQLAAPTNLVATAKTTSQIDLSWKDNSTTESGFEVDRKVSPTGVWSRVGTVAANATSYTVTGLGSNHTFYFRVRAVSALGLPSGYSNEASATTSTSAIAEGRLTVNGLQLTARPGMGKVLFQMPKGGAYSLSVHDLSGREVWQHAGSGDAVWNHNGNLKKGVYLVRAEQNGKAMKTSYCHVW